MAKTSLKIEGMMCEGCVANVKNRLEGLEGVTSVDVNLKKVPPSSTMTGYRMKL